jgi:hypothetical protein
MKPNSGPNIANGERNLAQSISNLAANNLIAYNKKVNPRGSMGLHPNTCKGQYSRSIQCEHLVAFEQEISFQNSKNKDKLSAYVSLFEQLLKFVFCERIQLRSDFKCPQSFQSTIVLQYVLECAFILDYKRHAMNCDVLIEETKMNPSSHYNIHNGLKEFIPKNFIYNLQKNSSCILNFDSDLPRFLKLTAQSIAEKKEHIISLSSLMSRQRIYLENLQKYISMNMRPKDDSESGPTERTNFYHCLNLLTCFHKNESPVNQFALMHFFAFCMAIAKNRLSFNSSDPKNLVNEIVSAFGAETDYEEK